MAEELEQSLDNLNLTPIRELQVSYCGVCSGSYEYCEFNASKLPSCKSWLAENDAEAFALVYPNEVAGEGDEVPNDAAVKPKQTQKKKAAIKKKVLITIHERTKRKRVVHIMGLDLFDIDLKKAAKMFANKFACGAAVTKTGAELDEIVVQGDCSYELTDYILENFEQIVDKDIEITEAKKKGKPQ